jgi:hypothetical protein
MTRERPTGTGAKARSAASRNSAGPAAPAQRGSAPVPSDDAELRQEIKRTREELGETVEALVAKTDVKARAKDRANQLSERVRHKTVQAKAEAMARAGQVRSQFTGKAAGARHAAVSDGGPAENQFQARPAVVVGLVRGAAPAALQRAALRVVAAASQRRVLVAAAAAGATVAGYLALRRWARR